MKSHIKELLMGDHPSYKITVVLAMSTFRPVGSWSSNGMRERESVCVCVYLCVWTEWTWSMHYIGISTYQLILYYASAVHKHTHPSTIWGLWTDRLKVDIFVVSSSLSLASFCLKPFLLCLHTLVSEPLATTTLLFNTANGMFKSKH